MDDLSRATNVRALTTPLQATKPKSLACMLGSAWLGDGARLLQGSADSLDA